jgi:hypothetical protein
VGRGCDGVEASDRPQIAAMHGGVVSKRQQRGAVDSFFDGRLCWDGQDSLFFGTYTLTYVPTSSIKST